jgi:hypothetical protein
MWTPLSHSGHNLSRGADIGVCEPTCQELPTQCFLIERSDLGAAFFLALAPSETFERRLEQSAISLTLSHQIAQ